MRWFVIMSDDRFYVRFNNTDGQPEWTYNIRRAMRFRGEEAAMNEARRYLPSWRTAVTAYDEARELVA